ncbi:ABC transporter G family member 2-like [Toxorhynchites rutilus septentrionalis]|uniref:ABC transporter G family member 2-like n=1 Tax=Toxorhynchites rutilus septentrionalis TaxID=329112 RepID=UPI00247AF661|nr:ABC transporter G family member 2-like [Toxorhynchites rutilus septentrionalis]
MGTDTAIAIDIQNDGARQSTCLSFRQIAYQVKGCDGKTKCLLQDVSGSFRSGRLTAILGPSGAGKSTLLNILSGFKTKKVTGEILINGAPIEPRKYRREVTYTTQDVSMLGNITVMESLEFASELKLPKTVSRMVKTKTVNDIIKLLGLQKCAHNHVETISGGEKKRLSIGLELVSNPKILFFDEPTSGLDIIAAMQMITHLKELALSGRCVICVIHQPSSSILQMYDDLMVLSEGRCIYRGPLEELVSTFKASGFECPNYYNRADFALEVASLKHEGNVLKLIAKVKEDQHSIEKEVNESIGCGEGDAMLKRTECDNVKRTDAPDRQYPVSQWSQFMTLTKRTTLCTFRDMQLMKMRVLAHVFVGLLIGVVFWDVGNDGSKVLSNASCLFFFLIFIFFSNSMPLVMTFPLETAVFIRERMNNWYSLTAYFFSKLVADFPFLILGPTLFLASSYYMTAQPMEMERMVMLWGICILTAWIAQLTGLLAGSSMPLELSVFCVPCSVIPMLIFCGFFVRFREMFDFLIPFTYIGYFRYSFEGAMQAIYGFGRENIPCEKFCFFGKVSKFLESFDMVDNTFTMDVCSLLVWILVLHVALFASLAFRLKRNHITLNMFQERNSEEFPFGDKQVIYKRVASSRGPSSARVTLERYSMNQVDPTEVVIPLIESSTTVLAFKNLNYCINQKCLLKNISGAFRSGRLTAIIGPSGAGKSTLLNILSGFRVNGFKGQILINNESIDRQRYRKLVAYNAQHVTLLPNITVQETLSYAADLKMPSTNMSKIKLVNEIITLLGLEKCAHNQAKVLSGGEKKRLSIGEELVSNPRIMFFDEPTSGLDSESSYQVLSYMNELARQGRCVVSVIHQPSSDLLELFDDIFVVADGRCLYRGSLNDLIPTFARVGLICPQYYNPADFAMKVLSKSNSETEKIKQLLEQMETVSDVEPSDPGLQSPGKSLATTQYPISQWRQFTILTRRTALGTVRNFTLTVLRFVGHILFGLIVGSVYYNIGDDGAKVLSNIAFIMLILLFIVFSNAMTVVLTFPLEMSVFIREYRSNCYSVTAYFFSKVVADFPLMIGGITCFQLVAYYTTGQANETNRIVMFWSMCALMGWFAQVYGMLGGSIFPIDISPFVVPTMLIPAVLFCGFFIRYNELADAFKPLTYISPFRFTFEGIAMALYGYRRKDLGCSEMFCYYRKATKVLDMLDMVNADFWFDVGGISLIICALHVALYISLCFKLR